MTLKPAQINHYYPVDRINVYPNKVIEVIRANRNQINLPDPPSRQERPIRMLTKKSLNKLAFTVTATETQFQSMFTLTYLDAPLSGRECKRQLRQLLTRLKSDYGNYAYLWFLEFTRRGMPHFHVLTTIDQIDPPDRSLLAWLWIDAIKVRNWPYCSLKTGRVHTVKEATYKVHSHPKNWQPVKKKDGAKRYALKYALKPYQKIVPDSFADVGRFWGCSYEVIPKPAVVGVDITEDELRKWIGENNPVSDWQVLPKYIFPRS